MLSDFLKKHIQSQAEFVRANGYGYAQVEPNHLSGQATKEIYAQLPAAADIKVLEQGQFAKYDYLNGVVNFSGAGDWMLVYNEIKLYRDGQDDCEFALLKDNFQARVYSPFGGDRDGHPDTMWTKQSRYYNGVDNEGHDSITLGDKTYKYDDVTAAPDMYELHYNEDPFHIESLYKEKMMPEGTTMVPRLIATKVGDIYTTNCIGENAVALGDVLVPRTTDGILVKEASANADTAAAMRWQVVKLYTMPDHQPGVKLIRIK